MCTVLANLSHCLWYLSVHCEFPNDSNQLSNHCGVPRDKEKTTTTTCVRLVKWDVKATDICACWRNLSFSSGLLRRNLLFPELHAKVKTCWPNTAHSNTCGTHTAALKRKDVWGVQRKRWQVRSRVTTRVYSHKVRDLAVENKRKSQYKRHLSCDSWLFLSLGNLFCKGILHFVISLGQMNCPRCFFVGDKRSL